MSKKTGLYDEHIRQKARIVDFHGWLMPVQYAGILEEHTNTRNKVSLFDVSHMGEFLVKGTDAKSFLDYLTTNDVGKLAIGKAQYSMLLNEQGTIIDDITVYCITPNEEYQICVNASNREKDFQHLEQVAKRFNITLKDISDAVSLIAVQGPNALELLKKIIADDIENITYYGFRKKKYVFDTYSLLARMGYTGEDGFEWFIPNEVAAVLWQRLLEEGKSLGVQPAGLGARDTLRVEMGFALYGNDISEAVTPLEANLAWVVDMNKDFIGKKVLENQKIQGVTKKLRGLILEEKAIPRSGFSVFDANNREVGKVTSGTFSPLLQKGIAMAYLPTSAKIGDTFWVRCRDKNIPASVHKFPFIPTIRKK